MKVDGLYDKGYSDLSSAIEHNGVSVPEDFEVLAEILSEHHDEGEYFWCIQDTKTKLFYVITGSHDYTGWDCQSGASITDPFDSLNQLQLYVVDTDNQNRPIRSMMLEQLRRIINAEDVKKDVKQIVNE